MAVMESVGVFAALLDLAKRLKDLSDAAARNAIVVDLQEKILAAQAAQAELAERERALKQRVAELETWEAEKQRHELYEFVSGQFAYALKEEASSCEPSHLLCANCYCQNKKSILHKEIRMPGLHDVTFCQGCGSDWYSSSTGGRPMPPKSARARG